MLTANRSTPALARPLWLAATLSIALSVALWGGAAVADTVEIAPAERSAALLRVLDSRAATADTQGVAVASMHRSLEEAQRLAGAALEELEQRRGGADSEPIQLLLLEGENLRYAYDALRTAEQGSVRPASPGRQAERGRTPAGRGASRSNPARTHGTASSRDQREQALRAAERVLAIHDALERSLGVANSGRTSGLLRRLVRESGSALELIQRRPRASRVIQRETPEVRRAPVALESQPAAAIRPPMSERVQVRAGTVVTPEITALAAELNNDALEIYLHVRNNFRFEPYFGCLKGAQATLETGAGNDYDLAALTGSLLEASGYTVRYARGTAIIPAQAMLEWLGLEDIDAANPILNTAGISAVPVVSGPTVVHYRVDRLWVEVESVPRPGSTPAWFPLDTAFKRHDLAPGIPGLFGLVPFDEATYLSLPRTELAYEFYQEQIRSHLAANMPGTGIDDVPLGMSLVPETLSTLPRSLPYSLYSLDAIYSAIPSSLAHKATVRVRYLGVAQFSYELVLPDTALQRVTVSYAPSGGNVIPQLKLDGTIVATGSAVPDLAAAELEVAFVLPNGVADGTEVHSVLTGEWGAVGIDAFQISETHIQRQVKSIVDAIALQDAGGTPDDDDLIGAFLYLAMMQYLDDVRTADETLADLAHYKVVHQVKEGLASANTELLSIGGIPFTTVPGNTVVDVPRLNRSSFARDDDNSLQSDLRRLGGINGSAQEHGVWEGFFNVPAISTIKSLQLANVGGIPVFVIDDNDADPNNNCSILCPQLTLSPTTVSGISSDVASGNRVTVPRDPTPLIDWTGVGYITESPSGSVGYIISGGLNSFSSGGLPGRRPPFALDGGAVAVVLEDGTILWIPVGDIGDGQGTANTGDPVNIANGNFFRDETDFEIPALVEPLGVMRVYNSQSTFDGSFGLGWSHNYGDMLAVQPDMSVIWIDARGAARTFQPDVSPGTFVSPPGLRETLIDTGGGFTLTRYDGRVQTFDAAGSLLSRADRNGNIFNFGYDGMGRIDTVTDPASRSLTLTYNAAGKIATVSDFTARSWTYAYDASDRLMSVTSPADGQTQVMVTQYTYDGAGRLETITEPNGGVRTIRYYANGRTARVIDPHGKSMDLIYNPFKSETRVINERGFAEIHAFNASGNRISQTYADGSVDRWSWVDNRMTAHVDPLGVSETFDYDGSGNLMQTADASSLLTDFTYHPTYGNVATITRPGARVTTLTYDTQGNLWQYLDSDGSLRVQLNNAAGLPETVTEPGGAVVTVLYNGAGQMTERTTQLPTTELLTYTPTGRLMVRTDANGDPTTHGYDLLDRLVSLTDAESQTATLSYDQAGRLVSSTDPRGHSTTYEYDLLDRLVRRVHPDGSDVRLAYDELGNLIQEIDELGRVTRHEYDLHNRRTVTRFADGGVLRLAYDAAGRLSSSTDPLGNTTSYGYDDAGRVVTSSDALGNTIVTSYDGNGNVQTTTDRESSTVTLEYDGLNRIVERRQQQGPAVDDYLVETTDYDDNGYVTARTRYDVSGLASIPADPRTLPSNRQRTTLYDYDVLNRLEFVTDGSGGVTQYGYDDAGNTTSVTDARSKTRTFEYDKVGRRTKVIQRDTGAVLLGYDAAGNRIRMTTAEGGVYVWAYDERNRPIAFTDPLGNKSTYEYDTVGNLVRRVNPDGSWITRSYDPRNRLRRESRSDGSYTSVVYDVAGNMLRVTTERTQLDFTYDALNRRTGETLTFRDGGFSKAVGVDYDDEGRPTLINDPTGRTLSFLRDLAGRLEQIDDSAIAGGPDVTIGYSGFGNRGSIAYGNGLSSTLTYDLASRVTGIDWTSPIAQFTYNRDAAGNPLVINESLGGVAEMLSLAYDDVGRPTSATAAVMSLTRSESFGYDRDGNLLNPGTGATVGYNLASQPIGDGTTGYSHDRQGNQIAALGPGSMRVETKHDPSNRLKSIRRLTGNVLNGELRFTYDGLDRLVEIDDGASVRRIVYLGHNRIAEFDGAGNPLRSYTVSPDVDDVFALTDAGGARYLHRDAVGSVRAVTDGAGVVVNTTDYGLFGRVLAAGGPETAALGFSGRPYDPATGLVDMRARHYDPSTGRFLARDPLPLEPGAPNPYAYAANRPLMFVDPLGLSPGFGWLDGLQLVLDIGGLIPVIGEPLDLINAGIYTARGDYLNAALSGASAIPLAGWAASGAKGVNRAVDAVDAAHDVSRAVDAADAVNDAARGIRYGPLNPGPLPDSLASTFRSGSYTGIQVSEPTTLYRVYGGTAGEVGSYWSRTPPAGPLQSQIDLALDPSWGNTATQVSRIEVPPGTTIYEGFAAPQGGLLGGGNQVVIPSVDSNWIVP